MIIPGIYLDQDQEFWTKNVVKRHFEEWWKQSNIKLFLWDFYSDCTSEWYIRENNTYGNNGYRFHHITIKFILYKSSNRFCEFTDINIVRWLKSELVNNEEEVQSWTRYHILICNTWCYETTISNVNCKSVPHHSFTYKLHNNIPVFIFIYFIYGLFISAA